MRLCRSHVTDAIVAAAIVAIGLLWAAGAYAQEAAPEVQVGVRAMSDALAIPGFALGVAVGWMMWGRNDRLEAQLREHMAHVSATLDAVDKRLERLEATGE